VRSVLIGVVATALVGLACAHVWNTFRGPVHWTPDSLYYEARVLEVRGTGHDVAMRRTFQGPISAQLRARDPQKTANPAWVEYNEPFYQRRVAVPLAAAALYPVSGDRSLLYVSLAGYLASILALFGFLLLRFRLPVATLITLGTVYLPPLVSHSSFPLTDSWGVALEILAFTAALLMLERGARWLPLWAGSLVLLSFVRDSVWIPVLAAGWLALRSRLRLPTALFLTGLAAALPALLAYMTPARPLLAELVNNSRIPHDGSWVFVVRHYPHAVLELVRANVGYLRRGQWFTAVYLVGGVCTFFALSRRRLLDPSWASFLRAATVFGLLYVLAAPLFSAFRLELVFVPVAAFGLALAAERFVAEARERVGGLERVGGVLAVRARR
jgi:hypothetical protein